MLYYTRQNNIKSSDYQRMHLKFMCRCGSHVVSHSCSYTQKNCRGRFNVCIYLISCFPFSNSLKPNIKTKKRKGGTSKDSSNLPYPLLSTVTKLKKESCKHPLLFLCCLPCVNFDIVGPLEKGHIFFVLCSLMCILMVLYK